jgi:hypothetical protein
MFPLQKLVKNSNSRKQQDRETFLSVTTLTVVVQGMMTAGINTVSISENRTAKVTKQYSMISALLSQTHPISDVLVI